MPKAVKVKDLQTGTESWESFDDFSRKTEIKEKIRNVVALAENKGRTTAERLDSIIQGLKNLYQ